MELRFLGGAREVGRSALLVNDRLLLDFGILAGEPLQFPLETPTVEAIVASHGHLDHVGNVPTLMRGDDWPEIHWTPPTGELARTLAHDTLKLHGVPESGAATGRFQPRELGGTYNCPFTETHVKRTTQQSRSHGYREPFTAAGHEITFFDAGHIPGSAHVLVDDGDTRLLYTGDFHTDDQRLVAGTTARPEADLLVVESTYSDVEHEDRGTVEERFVRSVEQTLWEGGTVVIPAFAIGRTQEMLLLCAAHDIPCYVDGMGKAVTDMLLQYPEFVRDPEALRRARSHARFVTGRDGQRRRIAEKSTAIVTTSGMLTGGPAMTYIPAIKGDPTNKIALTGYQVADTPGRDLLETGSAEIDNRRMRVSAQVEQYDFSAHADRDGLLAFLDSYRDTPVLVNHGDRCESFAAELREAGFEATAPRNGDSVAF
ncbi:MBL fold metallo-hydrolase [Halodesulfurarchaeum formicicum]|uniref:MBL fold metallo-hydrolase n=2 Tax=Halodesulfurarchaeum formicicum TaxID=1873524 RepID=A0A1J1ADD7_9EURY|nr:MBL fold metallo-hydrolase [Halodesulfurarchaeum formicicum]APE96158.1 MBL fold metallo-hydrolase [Halodesulfurarchaeum formicicum]